MATLTIFHRFSPFWTILNHFGPFGTILDHFRPFWPFWPFLTIFDHFQQIFGIFFLNFEFSYSEFFSGRFDTSGSMVPRLVPEILSKCAFCDEAGAAVVGIGDSRSLIFLWITMLVFGVKMTIQYQIKVLLCDRSGIVFHPSIPLREII